MPASDQVDVVNDIDWHETHVLLKAAFPLAATSRMATYEIPYGTIQRPTTRNNSWETGAVRSAARCAGPTWATGSTASA